MSYTPMTEEQDRELRRQFAEEQRRTLKVLDEIIEMLTEREAKGEVR